MTMPHEITQRSPPRLSCWLLEVAYPLWSQSGWDERRGGVHERLSADGPRVADADGSFVREPSPASSFQHIVCATGELSAALHGAVA